MDDETQAMKEELESLSSIVECECTERMCQNYAIRYLAEKCETEFLTLLDADDVLLGNFFEAMLSDEADFIIPSSYMDLADGKIRERVCCFLRGNLTGVYRKSAFLNLGGLGAEYVTDPVDTGFVADTGGQDTDFLLTALGSSYDLRLETNTSYFFRSDFKNEQWRKTSMRYDSIHMSRRETVWKHMVTKHKNNMKVTSDLDTHHAFFNRGTIAPGKTISSQQEVLISHPLDDQDGALWDTFLCILAECYDGKKNLVDSSNIELSHSSERIEMLETEEGKPEVARCRITYSLKNKGTAAIVVNEAKITYARMGFLKTFLDHGIKYCPECAAKGDYRNYGIF